MAFKVQKIKGKVKETEAKAYTPKKVKYTANEVYDTHVKVEDKQIKTADNSIQGLLNACDSSVKSIIQTKEAKTYIAGSNNLMIVFKDKTKLRIEYLNQPKVKLKQDAVKYTLLDSHNRKVA